MAFTHTSLSYSRIARYASCPLSFRLHYIDRQVAEPNRPMRFGKAIHAVLEVLVREHMLQERVGPLCEERAAELWQQSWHDLGGVEVFQEGLDILRAFVRNQGALDHHDILAVEKKFQLTAGRFGVRGVIDRVDRIDDETIEVIDYKTNRLLFSRDEMDHNLQLSLYHAAAKQLWPWAKTVKLAFHMLRHGVCMRTERTPEQIDTAFRYVEAIGQESEQASDYPARLNSNCVYCDHRQHCPAYADALLGKRDVVCEDENDLEAVAREREEVARLAKILTARKSELETVLKTHLEHEDELLLAGVRYRMFRATRAEYPVAKTLELLSHATDVSRDDLIERLAVIDNKALDKLLKELGKELTKGPDRSSFLILKAELDAMADKTHTPRFWAKEMRV